MAFWVFTQGGIALLLYLKERERAWNSEQKKDAALQARFCGSAAAATIADSVKLLNRNTYILQQL